MIDIDAILLVGAAVLIAAVVSPVSPAPTTRSSYSAFGAN